MSNLSPEKIAQAPQPATLPISGAAEVVALRIADRRKKLVEHQKLVPHKPQGIALAAVGLSAGYEIANGHTPNIRADRQVRYRIEQFAGGEPMPLEDLTTIGEESEFGRGVAIATFTAILAAWGMDVVPSALGDSKAALLRSMGEVAKSTGEFVEAITEAESDSTINASEAADIAKQARHLAQKAQVTARVAANRALKAQKTEGR